MSVEEDSYNSANCETVQQHQHLHDFGQGKQRKAEKRTLLVTLLTLVTMFAEILGGWLTGSMALLADGIHMGGHALALGLATLAYYLARRHARDRRLSLGSGKIIDLAAWTSALFLAATTVWLVFESIHRLLAPQDLMVREAMLVAVLGLLVNLFSAWLLAGAHEHHHHHDDHHHHHDHDKHHDQPSEQRQDNNLKAALVHVIADAVTSVAAIAGLLAAWLWGWQWLDPVIALVASAVILRWAVGLLKQTAAVLLDMEGPEQLRARVHHRLEGLSGVTITDLHLWSVGQGAWTLVVSLVTHDARITPDGCKALLVDIEGLHHPIVEVHYCSLCNTAD